jgi:hypothetical protein
MSASIWDADALVDFTGWSFVFFASGVRLFRQQRSESLSLRHDATRLYRDEKRRHYRRDS